MTIPTLFKQYIWLVNTIHKAGSISLVEINQLWVQTEMSGGVPLARTTFNRHKDAIQDIFGIYIECARRNNYRYYIGNEEVLREESVQNWMLSTLSVSNLISESMSLQNRILLEQIPSDGAALRIVISAMKQNSRVEIEYQRYSSADSKSYAIDPYCIKLFRRRWYLLGRFDDGGYAMFSFDRINDVRQLDERFVLDPDFDAAHFFDECFGVVIGDGSKPERIVLRAYGLEPYYLRDLPLHSTQRELESNEEWTDFEYYLRPTNDFQGYILSHGPWLKVLSPPTLVQDIRTKLQQSLENYVEK
ncbi:MAG: WYL domain-containing protein [Bacteroidales bacterium]|nr:WYL domain-containing protein [Bacteroidales bacterium]